jgi:AraC-like ligand binding domain/Helix-turn-helix domain
MHRVVQHRSASAGIEARTIASIRSFPRHTHDQFGVGVILAGAHRSWSGIGPVEVREGDVIMVNPGEMHDGMPVGGRPREWRMLYFEPSLLGSALRDDGIAFVESVRPAVHDPLLADSVANLFRAATTLAPSALAIDERLTLHVRLARRLLAEGNRIVDAALRAGFADQSHLTRAFVRQYGVTPGRYVAALS